MKYPIIDNRKFEDFTNEMKELVPYFTPEWKFSPDDGEVGTALFMVTALQYTETVELLNKSLNNNFLSFLNYLNVNLNPPRPSRLPLVFSLSEGSEISVPLKKGVGVIGVGEDVESPIRFETESLIEVTPTKILSTYWCSGKKDIIEKISDIQKPFLCFNTDKYDSKNNNRTNNENNNNNNNNNDNDNDDNNNNNNNNNNDKFEEDAHSNLQEHSIYISNDYILECSSNMEFQIIFEYAPTISKMNVEILTNSEYFSWSYNSKDTWVEFDSVSLERNIIKLTKNNDIPITKSEFHNCRWIRCTVKNGKIELVKDFLIDSIYLKARMLSNSSAVKTNLLYYNENALDMNDCLPFGEFFNIYDNFYIGSNDVFSKKGATIEFSFKCDMVENKISTEEKNIDWKPVMRSYEVNKAKDPIISIHTLKWQYFDGIIWKNIAMDKKHEKIFYYLNAKQTYKINFNCPDDIEKIEINGETAYYIRAVIERVENAFRIDGIYVAPKLNEIKLTFNYSKDPVNVERFVINNNLEIEDKYNMLRASGITVNPFKSIGYLGNVIYICFDAPLINGPINLLYVMDKINNLFIYNKKVKFQYLCEERGRVFWKEEKIFDETKGLTQTGIISFSGLNNFAKNVQFLTEGYWIRLLFNTEDKTIRYVNGMYLNAVWALQQTSIYKEYIDLSEENKDVFLSQKPIVDFELWVNEIDSLSQNEIREITRNKNIEQRTNYDDMGLLSEFWVQWKEVEHFYHSLPNDRVYKLDNITGKLEFGNDIRGKLPPVFLKNSVYANYKVGGGTFGNIQKYAIKQIEEPIAFIDNVYNPESGTGGADLELLSNAVNRATRKIRHRDRGVSDVDLEDLVKEVSSDIYKVRCIRNVNNEMKEQRGSLALVILLKDNILEGISYTLKNDIERYLSSRIPCSLLSSRLYICDPEIITIDSSISLILKKDYDKVLIRDNSKIIVNNFLNFKTGNHDGKGWSIGMIPRDSSLYGALSGQKGVLNITNISLKYYLVNKVSKTEVPFETISKMKNVIVVSGTHKVEITSLIE